MQKVILTSIHFIKGDNLTISVMRIQTIPFKHVYIYTVQILIKYNTIDNIKNKLN